MTTHVPSTPGKKGLFWAFVPAGLLVGLLGMQLSLLGGALSDPSFAVEADYYQKALDWDTEMEHRRASLRLGWTAALATEGFGPDGAVEVRLTGPDGRHLEGAQVALRAFPNDRAARVREVTLREVEPGTHRAPLLLERAGLWEFRLVATRGQDRFVTRVRRDVGAARRAP